MVTAFGKFCRKLRIDHGEILKNMADKLDVKSSFLSAVELGKKKIPAAWENTIIDLYKLNVEQAKELKSAIECSVSSIKINLTEYNANDRDLVLSFARRFESLSEEDKNELRNWFKDE